MVGRSPILRRTRAGRQRARPGRHRRGAARDRKAGVLVLLARICKRRTGLTVWVDLSTAEAFGPRIWLGVRLRADRAPCTRYQALSDRLCPALYDIRHLRESRSFCLRACVLLDPSLAACPRT